MNFSQQIHHLKMWMNSLNAQTPRIFITLWMTWKRKDDWCGVHDGGTGREEDGEEYWCYSSYEIKDFNTAIEKWSDFFKSKGKLK